MKLELQDKLCKEFPILFPGTQYFECGDGWYNLIWELCYKLTEEITNSWPVVMYPSIYVVQVKEKFGRLRFYLSVTDDDLEKIIRDYERYSSRTCEVCGKPAVTKNVNGWLKTMCRRHK